jgi:hypothetical protein
MKAKTVQSLILLKQRTGGGGGEGMKDKELSKLIKAIENCKGAIMPYGMAMKIAKLHEELKYYVEEGLVYAEPEEKE